MTPFMGQCGSIWYNRTGDRRQYIRHMRVCMLDT
jgi:hypothetical protein